MTKLEKIVEEMKVHCVKTYWGCNHCPYDIICNQFSDSICIIPTEQIIKELNKEVE